MLQKGGSLEMFSLEAEGFHNLVYEVLVPLAGPSPAGSAPLSEMGSLPLSLSEPFSPQE